MNAAAARIPEVSAAPPPAETRRTAIAIAVVLLATFLAYAGTFGFDFVYDDTPQIVVNPVVQSWRNIPSLFSQHVWIQQTQAVPNFYRPVFMTWCALNFQAFHLKPAGWHVGVVLLHLIATLLVFFLARRLLEDELAAALVALIFGVHPIHIESVAWISGATDPLLGIFCVGSFLCYLRFRDGGAHRAAWLAASFAQYGLACLTKEPGIVLPGVIVVYEWVTNRDTRSARIRRVVSVALPYAAVASLYLVQRYRVLGTIGHAVNPVPLSRVPLSWPRLMWFYVEKVVWPVRLSLYYGIRIVTQAGAREFWLPLAGVAAVAALLAWWIRRLPETPAGDNLSLRAVAFIALAWFLLPLLPVLDVLSLEPGELAHDRYLYLPALGFALLAAIAIRGIRFGERRIAGEPAVQVAGAAVLAIAMFAGTVQQSVYWANDFLLYYRAAKITPTSLSAMSNLASMLLDRHDYENGIRLHEQILRADPNYWQSHFNLGNVYYKLGKYDLAEEHLLRATQINPTQQNLMYLSLTQLKNQHLSAAEANLRELIKRWPATVGSHYALGLVLQEEGRWPEAVAAYQLELAISPDQPAVRSRLAAAEKHIEK